MVFWNEMTCSLLDRYQRFGGTYCLYFKSKSTLQTESSSGMLVCIYQTVIMNDDNNDDNNNVNSNGNTTSAILKPVSEPGYFVAS
jgi:hypothetical protein